ncbi:MAG: hypothetical protein SFZ23_05735 [Planctomycetota bacterium]|nr:hypothetical protein [Planctomycetota bacterium]
MSRSVAQCLGFGIAFGGSLAAGQTYALRAVTSGANAVQVLGGLSPDGTTIVGFGSTVLSSEAVPTFVFRWTQAGGFEFFSNASATPYAEAYGTSDNAQFTVGVVSAEPVGSGAAPLIAGRWDSVGTFTPIQGPADAPEAPRQAFAVTNDGTRAVGVVAVPDLGERAAIFPIDGPAEVLSVPGSEFGSRLSHVSADGNTVFGTFIGQQGAGTFRRVGTGPFQTLPVLAPDNQLLVRNINAAGTIAVGYTTDASFLPAPFVWRESSNQIETLPLGDFLNGETFDTTPDGSRIVGYVTDGGEWYPALWQNGQVINLLQLLASNGVEILPEYPFFYFWQARAISADGTTITGSVYVSEGFVDYPITWLATIPALGTSCAADFNNDGQADFIDYLDFVGAYSQEDPAADVDGNGQVDFFDYLTFSVAFDEGCE